MPTQTFRERKEVGVAPCRSVCIGDLFNEAVSSLGVMVRIDWWRDLK